MTDAPKFHLKQVLWCSLKQTEIGWDKQLKKHSKELLASEFERILEFAKAHAVYTGNPGASYAYGIFAVGEDEAIAIAELIYQRSAGKWLKLLNLHVCPAVDIAFSSQSVDIRELSHIFGAAILGTVK